MTRNVRIVALLCFCVLALPAARAGMTTDDLTGFWLENSDLGHLKAGGKLRPTARNVSLSLLAKAQPDECFCGVPPLGPPYPANPTNTPPPCVDCGIPKVNQAYVWGLTLAESNLWFGTAANVHCLVLGAYLGATNPIVSDSFVAEFGHSYYSQVVGVPAILGDWRPPRLFMYDRATSALVPKDGPLDLAPLTRGRLATTIGIRSAGTWPGSVDNPQSIVFLAGPRLATNGGLNVFAFNAVTKTNIGSSTLAPYNNIRKWLYHEGVLYTAVGNTNGGGSVLRWQSNPATPGYPFAFEVIGHLDGAGVELTVHEGRLFVCTWPGLVGTIEAGLWMSPVIPPGGLTAADAGNWQKVWEVSDYEPDIVTARTYGGGALVSFDGYLYWGTMHVPALALAAHSRVYGEPADQDAMIATFLATHRAISIFRGRNFGTTPEVDLLYGARRLPAYNPGTQEFLLTPNNMGGQAPLFGPQGFGNLFNNYTWTMEVVGDNLYVGTMDFSYLVWDMLPRYLDADQMQMVNLYLSLYNINPADFFGADLFRFRSARDAAIPVHRQGAGNYSSYGIRTMVTDGSTLFLGMANPMNLMTDPDDDKPEGGWELIAMRRYPAVDNDFDGDGRSDLAVYDPAAGRWYIRRTAGKMIALGAPWGSSAMTPIPGEYNGDGLADLAVYDRPSGRWYIRTLAGKGITFGERWGGPLLRGVWGDYDGDALADLPLFETSRGEWFIRSRAGGSHLVSGLDWGSRDMTPVSGDYNGDEIRDLAAYHAASGRWYIRSLAGTKPVLAFALQWGAAGMFPVSGDFDGDGRHDLALYQPAGGRWYIRSLTGAKPLAFGLQWGGANMIPVSGDYDGDGRHDLALYDATSGRWYIRSLAGGKVIAFGANWGTPAMTPVGAAW